MMGKGKYVPQWQYSQYKDIPEEAILKYMKPLAPPSKTKELTNDLDKYDR